ncbi:MAG: hypothetical protein RLZZ282_510, partial [Verrucomicrobiota bacterium]
IPPMTWLSKSAPAAPGVAASLQGKTTTVSWVPDSATAKIAVQARSGGAWRTVKILPASQKSLTIPRADAIAITALDRYGNASPPKVLGLR